MCFPRNLRRLCIQAKWTVVTSCLDGPFYTCVRERVLIKGVLIFVYEHARTVIKALLFTTHSRQPLVERSQKSSPIFDARRLLALPPHANL